MIVCIILQLIDVISNNLKNYSRENLITLTVALIATSVMLNLKKYFNMMYEFNQTIWRATIKTTLQYILVKKSLKYFGTTNRPLYFFFLSIRSIFLLGPYDTLSAAGRAALYKLRETDLGGGEGGAGASLFAS